MAFGFECVCVVARKTQPRPQTLTFTRMRSVGATCSTWQPTSAFKNGDGNADAGEQQKQNDFFKQKVYNKQRGYKKKSSELFTQEKCEQVTNKRAAVRDVANEGLLLKVLCYLLSSSFFDHVLFHHDPVSISVSYESHSHLDFCAVHCSSHLDLHRVLIPHGSSCLPNTFPALSCYHHNSGHALISVTSLLLPIFSPFSITSRSGYAPALPTPTSGFKSCSLLLWFRRIGDLVLIPISLRFAPGHCAAASVTSLALLLRFGSVLYAASSPWRC